MRTLASALDAAPAMDDGIRLHEATKVELSTYAKQHGVKPVKPFMLVIARGLRLPYCKRTDVEAVDRLSIVAHDRFQEIVDEANRDDSLMRKIILIELDFEHETPRESVAVKSTLEAVIVGGNAVTGTPMDASNGYPRQKSTLTFANDRERQVAEATWLVIKGYQHKPSEAPTSPVRR